MLLSIGLDYADAQGTLLFSFGITNTIEQVEKAIEVLKKTVAFLRNMSPLYHKRKAG